MSLVLLEVSSIGHRGFPSERLESLLHSVEAAPVLAVLSKTPGKDTSETLGGDEAVDLLGDEVGSVPGPVQRGLGVPIPLATNLGVSLAVLHGSEERVLDVNSITFAKGRLAASSAVSSRASTISMLVDIIDGRNRPTHQNPN